MPQRELSFRRIVFCLASGLRQRDNHGNSKLPVLRRVGAHLVANVCIRRTGAFWPVCFGGMSTSVDLRVVSMLHDHCDFAAAGLLAIVLTERLTLRGPEYTEGLPGSPSYVCICTGDWYGVHCHKRASKKECAARHHSCSSSADCGSDRVSTFLALALLVDCS